MTRKKRFSPVISGRAVTCHSLILIVVVVVAGLPISSASAADDIDPAKNCRFPRIRVEQCLKAPDDQLPNLVPLAPKYVTVGSLTPPPDLLGMFWLFPEMSNDRALKFTTVVLNRGFYPLDLLGEPTTDPGSWAAHQCVGWHERVCIPRENVGEFVWHPEHRHWHLDDFALYELRRLDATGQPDFSPEGLIVSSDKISFCLLDYQREESDDPPFYVTCAGVSQGISPGWADVYDAGLPGQELRITGIPDGRYALVFTIDPTDRLAESDESDNVSYSVIELYEDGKKVQILQ